MDSVWSLQVKGFNMLQRYLILAAFILGFAKAGCVRSRTMTLENTQTKYIQQNLDHFSFANNRTFQQKYLINDQFWNSENSGPIFFAIGGEGPIGFNGYMVQLA